MSNLNEIRADYDQNSLIVYQAYSAAIAKPALADGRFVAPFSLNRMTWIKPSFLWLMHRSNWAQKSGQEYILAVRIKRDAWEKALSLGVLTGYEAGIHASYQQWEQQFAAAKVHIQSDPERSIRGADLGINSIQVGISRFLIEEYVQDWMIALSDYTPLVHKIHGFLKAGELDKAKKLLPRERPYPVTMSVAKALALHV